METFKNDDDFFKHQSCSDSQAVKTLVKARLRLVEEGKLEYRVSLQEVERFSQPVSSPAHSNLPGQPGVASSNIVKLKTSSHNLQFYGYVEDQPPEWAKLDYSLEVEII